MVPNDCLKHQPSVTIHRILHRLLVQIESLQYRVVGRCTVQVHPVLALDVCPYVVVALVWSGKEMDGT